MSQTPKSHDLKQVNFPKEFLSAMDESEKHLLGNVIKGYSKLRNDVITQQQSVESAITKEQMPPDPTSVEFVEKHYHRPTTSHQKPPRIHIPAALRNLESDGPQSNIGFMNMRSSKPSSRMGSASIKNSLSLSSLGQERSSSAPRPRSGDSTMSIRSVRSIMQARTDDRGKSPVLPKPKSPQVEPDPNLLFSTRTLSQRPNSPNSIILLTKSPEKDDKSAWKDVRPGFAPGPNFRVANKSQKPRFHGPIGTAPPNFPNPPPKPLNLLSEDVPPTNRIGTNYSPYTKDITPRKIRTSSRPSSASATYQLETNSFITRSPSSGNDLAAMSNDFGEPPAELSTPKPRKMPPLSTPTPKMTELDQFIAQHVYEDGVDASSPGTQRSITQSSYDTNFLPLELFDDIEMETRTPEEWVLLARAENIGAHSLYFYPDGHYDWKPCFVRSYNKVENSFLVEWVLTGKKKFVKRLNLRFEIENEAAFFQRISCAYNLKMQHEANLRYQACIDGLPDGDISPIDAPTLDRILRRIAVEFPSNLVSTIEATFSDIRVDYTRAMKKARFDYGLLDEVEVQKFSSIKLVNPAGKKATPEFGLVPVPRYNFRAHRESIEKKLMLTNSGLIKFFLKLSSLIENSRSGVLFKRPSQDEPMHIDKFTNIQSYQLDECYHQICIRLIPDVVSLIHSNLQSQFKFHFQNMEEYRRSDTIRLLELVDFRIDNVIKEVVLHSIAELTKFFGYYVNYRESRNEEHLPFKNTPNVGSIYCPLFLVRLVLDGNKVEFNPTIQELKEKVVRNFESISQFALKVVKVEGAIVSKPRLPLAYYTPFTDEDPYVRISKSEILQIINDDLELIESLLRDYRYFEGLFEASTSLVYESDKINIADLTAFRENVENYKIAASNALKTSRDRVSYGLLCIDCSELKQSINEKATQIYTNLLQALATRLKNHNEGILTRFEEIRTKIQQTPKNAEEWNEIKTYCESVGGLMIDLRKEMDQVQSAWSIVEEFEHSVPVEEFSMFWQTKSFPKVIQDNAENRSSQLHNERQTFMNELQRNTLELQSILSDIQDEVDVFYTLGDAEKTEEYAAKVVELQDKIRETQEKARLYNSRESLFGLTKSPFPLLFQVQKNLEPFSQLWTICSDFNREFPIWMDGPFTEVDAEKVEENVSNWRRTLQKVTRTLRDSPGPLSVGSDIKSKLDDFNTHMTLFKCLRNPGLCDRHWNMISQLGFPQIRPESIHEINFSMLLEMKMEDKISEIMEISELAGKEYLLEKTLENMIHEWKNINFDCVSYRDSGTHIIRATDDIMTLLDDQIAKTQSMRGSPFIKALEGRVRAWEEKLLYVQSILEEWLNCQKTYLYLEPIFGSKDIVAQMPAEGKKFQLVDMMWRKNMEATVKAPNVMAIAGRYNIKNNFVEANQVLEEIQKGLEEYLETKRGYFPRFFFLSNDELLEILSKTRDPTAVQPHLKKCFENIEKLDFTSEGKVVAMYSSENEEVPFASTHYVQTSAKVEEWLLGVEDAMLTSLKGIMSAALADYAVRKREDWIVKWPGQVVLAINKVMWTQRTHQAIREGTKSVREFENYLTTQLMNLVEMVRGDYSALARLTLEALIVLDVHGRDVITKLVQAEVSKEDDFDWMSQLRYYWEEKSLNVKMVNASLPYAYEYLGNSPRLVITPLTDRCYITLMSALYLYYGGAPEGPAGTGKTETCKDLAKAVAKQCVVFNCSDGLDYLAMGKFFKGIATSGAWCCFDEFNRIDVEVLSVIAQQILTIQRAIGLKKSRFVFEGREIKLDSSCAVFITMNPGYAGRSELPDNLKALFRPVAMMVPDYAMIAEISLLSYGFSDARNLARKIVSTFKLSSEQLSSQHHYDFGMRAVKAVLRAAGVLRRKSPGEKEALLVLRSLNDVNLPKFISEDLPLFDGIIRDLFPGVKLPNGDYKDLITEMNKAAADIGHQSVPLLINKTIQLFETIEVRHGVMLVGETYSGKTGCLKMLAAGLTALDSDPRYYPVRISSLNPKSVTMGQLYGQSDLVSHEWTDGILAKVVRDCSQDPSPIHKWIVFDGPVDSLWIENMNSALDDSKKLCLNSGEVIWLTQTMTFVFEVGDLSMASPATVSRCGMIYMEPSLLGWEPLMESWIQKLPPYLTGIAESIRNMFLFFVPKLLAFLRKHTKEMVPLIDTALVNNMITLLGCLCSDQSSFGSGEGAVRASFDAFFIFSVVWSLGANTDVSGRDKFDSYLRELLLQSGGGDFGGILTHVPDELHLYDYMYSPELGSWKLWLDPKSVPVIPEDVPISEILVPTVDTVRYSYLLRLYLDKRIPLLFVGPTGTGKTAIMKSQLLSAENEKVHPLFITFSGRTSANQTQDLIDSKLEKRRKTTYGPVGGSRMNIMIDDLNMPAREKFGAQPVIELLRQWMDNRGWYDRKTIIFHDIADILFVAAMGPPGGGRNAVTSRYLRHYHVIGITPPDDQNLKRIYGNILLQSLKTTATPFQDAIVESTIELYRTICSQLLPTPTKSHYLYNTRDLSRIFQGLSTAKDHARTQADDIVQLWVHECCRVFGDRLVNDQDRSWFKQLIQSICAKRLEVRYPLLQDDTPLLYGDFMDSQKKYAKLPPMDKLVPNVETHLEEYNNYSRKPMHLVLFSYAVEHMTRIARIIRQPNGHALLIGLEGSGRKSMTTLAAHVCGQDVFELDMGRAYGFNEWRDDLRKLMRKGGIEGTPVVFLLTDQQLSNEVFLEDINNILNTGEVPNLFAGDDLVALLNDMKPIAIQFNRADNKSQTLDFFWSRCRQYIHVIICMSPVGDSLRNRLRLFPSLVNCCTIDWFPEWPRSALQTVASNLLSDLVEETNMVAEFVDVCVQMHVDVENLSEKYLREVKRHFYVSPTTYLEFISVFRKFLTSKRQEVLDAKRRYEVGLQKLLSTEAEVGKMQKELVALKPMLLVMSHRTDELMKSIQVDREEASVTKGVVEKEEAAATIQAEEARKMKEECEADLQEVMPSLFEAQKSLETLNKNDVSEVKAMKSPPEGVRKVMEAVCIMLDIKPVLVDANRMGKKVYDYWESSKKMLSDSKFLLTLQTYDKDNIPQHIIDKLTPYIRDKGFEPAVMQKVSVAATSLCGWVRAIYKYHKVYKIVAPKREALKEAEEKFRVTMETVESKKKMLEEAESRIQQLVEKYDNAITKKNDLQAQVQSVEKKLDRAQRLIKGLGGEKDRWMKARDHLATTYELLVGDVLISSGIITYLGPFTATYRNTTVDGWVKLVRSKKIPCNENFNFINTIGDTVQIRQWQLDGLPPDRFSVENGIIVMKTGGRWPFMIDPQGQACKWVKNMESGNRIDVIKPADSDIMRRLENAVQFGNPVLIENMGETIDPQLYPIIMKATFRQGGQLMINIGGSAVMFSPSFRLYLTTKLPNPHYKPEICSRVALVNFMVTPEGVQDQLLGIVVAKERQELEEEKNSLVIQNAKFQSELKRIEDQILRLLSDAESNFLEDEVLIETLNASKITSQEIAEKIALSAETEAKIDTARLSYQPVAIRASLLYFCVADMANLEPMYQYSLAWFVNIFVKSIATAEASQNVPQRLKNLNSQFMYSLYRNICQSLFEKDKLMFSFLISSRIEREQGHIRGAEWRFFLTGGSSLGSSSQSRPVALSWLPENVWQEITNLAQLPAFSELTFHFASQATAWRYFYEKSDPLVTPLPEPYKDKLSPFQRLCLLRALRPDKVVPACQSFISATLDSKFIEPPPFDLLKSYKDSDNKTPIIFILSPGMDPMEEFMNLALKLGFRDKTNTISLGQGQGPIADRMVHEGSDKGRWILLQNCHLATSWMPTLEHITEELFSPSYTTCHPDFRLWLTSKPTPTFPVSILQNGIKLTNEPPKGIRANLLRTYLSYDSSMTAAIPIERHRAFRKLLFGLSFFHALIQERRKYGPLGWNNVYEFSEADLRISVRQLQNFLSEKEPPYKALKYLTGQSNYGGRVTDNWDRRTLASLLDDFYTEKIMDDRYKFSPSGNYYAPVDENISDYMAYVQRLPINDKPEICGLHENADITYARNETGLFVSSLLLMQPRSSGEQDGESQESVLEKVSADILARVPKPLDAEEIARQRPIRHDDCMTTVLLQEVIRYNNLLTKVRSSLVELQNALKGLVVMSVDLEMMAFSLFDGQVPNNWARIAYESRKPLAGWVTDLIARIKFIKLWSEKGPPNVFWLSGFFYPQAFLTGQLQNFARKHTIAIDHVTFDFNVMPGPCKSAATSGCYIDGLFLEGAQWDNSAGRLVESNPKELHISMPIIWLSPYDSSRRARDSTTRYACPVYKTSKRSGVLSSTGHSTNYVLTIELTTMSPPAHWVKRGVALICQTDF